MINDRNKIFDDIIENSKFLNDIFENNNIGIIAGRMVGKTSLSALILLNYINTTKEHPRILSLVREDIKGKFDQIGFYQNQFYKSKLLYNSKYVKQIKSISTLFKFLEDGRKIDIIFIDEIFYFKFTDYEMLLFQALDQKGIKLLFNGTIPGWAETQYINKLKKNIDYITINDKIIENLRCYNINSKLKKVISRINEQEENCSYIRG